MKIQYYLTTLQNKHNYPVGSCREIVCKTENYASITLLNGLVENTKTFYPFSIVGKLTMKWQNTFLLWNTDCKRVVWGLTVEVKMGGYYHYIGPLWWYQRGWHGHNCTCHNWPLSAPTHLTLSSSMSSLTLLVTVATKIVF